MNFINMLKLVFYFLLFIRLEFLENLNIDFKIDLVIEVDSFFIFLYIKFWRL